MLVDSNVILDVYTDDPIWGDWSESMLEQYSAVGPLYINPIVYSEVSISFAKIEELEQAIAETGLANAGDPQRGAVFGGQGFFALSPGPRRRPCPTSIAGHRRRSRICGC